MTTTQSTEPTKTITLNGRVFAVTTRATKYDARQYLLTGKRGAVYGTMRNANRPEQMFLIDARGFGIPAGWQGVWLTDVGGELRRIGA